MITFKLNLHYNIYNLFSDSTEDWLTAKKQFVWKYRNNKVKKEKEFSPALKYIQLDGLSIMVDSLCWTLSLSNKAPHIEVGLLVGS